MTAERREGRIRLLGRRRARSKDKATERTTEVMETAPVDIAPNDPILGYFQSAQGVVDLEGLEMDSPGLTALKGAGVKLVVPLVSQGELIGLLNLGPRLSEQEYSADDRKLLSDLAGQVAPALRLGQLVREQEAEARSLERIEQELKVAQLIQQQFLPHQLPELGGWQVAAFYRPAREVGGDFYDFIELPDGKVGVVIGDVTDKGVPAALVMASTRSILRSDATRLNSPGQVLERVNELLVPDIPAQMFVTCLYGILDPQTGTFVFANAGHNLPYVGSGESVRELRATGMPLGLLPGSKYEEKTATLAAGESILLHSDGIAEAHNTEREMFSFERLAEIVGRARRGDELIDAVMLEHDHFIAGGDGQEDDITLVALTRTGVSGRGNETLVLSEFTVPSDEGNERMVIDHVAEVVSNLGMEQARVEKLKTAVAETTMNAIEHGNGGRSEIPVRIRITSAPDALRIAITDEGGAQVRSETEIPDIEAKLSGEQTPRGWGLFLIKNMVDEMNESTSGQLHTVELVMHLEGATDGR